MGCVVEVVVFWRRGGGVVFVAKVAKQLSVPASSEGWGWDAIANFELHNRDFSRLVAETAGKPHPGLGRAPPFGFPF